MSLTRQDFTEEAAEHQRRRLRSVAADGAFAADVGAATTAPRGPALGLRSHAERNRESRQHFTMSRLLFAGQGKAVTELRVRLKQKQDVFMRES